jgi:hypothetical protein
MGKSRLSLGRREWCLGIVGSWRGEGVSNCRAARGEPTSERCT